MRNMKPKPNNGKKTTRTTPLSSAESTAVTVSTRPTPTVSTRHTPTSPTYQDSITLSTGDRPTSTFTNISDRSTPTKGFSDAFSSVSHSQSATSYSSGQVTAITVGVIGAVALIIGVILVILWILKRFSGKQKQNAVASNSTAADNSRNTHHYEEIPFDGHSPYAVAYNYPMNGNTSTVSGKLDDNVTSTSHYEPCHDSVMSASYPESDKLSPPAANGINMESADEMVLVENTVYGCDQ